MTIRIFGESIMIFLITCRMFLLSEKRWTGIKVFIATTHDGSLYRRQTLEAGAVGCFLKGSLKPSLEAAFGIQR